MQNEVFMTDEQQVVLTDEKPITFLRNKAVSRQDADESFLVFDLHDIVDKYHQWMDELPFIKPYYAMKANDDYRVLSVLASLGTGFDCASKNEINKVLSLGVDPSRILYAHPTKFASYIQYASQCGVYKMTFDNDEELLKIKENCPNAELVLRLMPPDDSNSLFPLSEKFGCSLNDVVRLLRKARQLDLNVIGLSFHVGSSSYEGLPFVKAVEEAKVAFELARQEGFHLKLLDVGGGFPGEFKSPISFKEMCNSLRPALEEHFPASSGVSIVAEPGTFFVGSAANLAARIIARRTLPDNIEEENGLSNSDDNEIKFMYYLSDGVYASFVSTLIGQTYAAYPLQHDYKNKPTHKCTLWGPTCSATDIITKSADLPEMEIGDWLMFDDMGCYTTVFETNFHGMPHATRYFICRTEDRELLGEHLEILTQK